VPSEMRIARIVLSSAMVGEGILAYVLAFSYARALMIMRVYGWDAKW
jgi:hypothetical protein